MSRPERETLPSVLLRLNPAVCLHWRRWDSEWIVFDVASGNTHQLDELTACALLCLEEGTLQVEALVAEVAAATSSPEEAIRPALQAAIAQLTRLGLVDTVPE